MRVKVESDAAGDEMVAKDRTTVAANNRWGGPADGVAREALHASSPGVASWPDETMLHLRIVDASQGAPILWRCHVSMGAVRPPMIRPADYASLLQDLFERRRHGDTLADGAGEEATGCSLVISAPKQSHHADAVTATRRSTSSGGFAPFIFPSSSATLMPSSLKIELRIGAADGRSSIIGALFHAALANTGATGGGDGTAAVFDFGQEPAPPPPAGDGIGSGAPPSSSSSPGFPAPAGGDSTQRFLFAALFADLRLAVNRGVDQDRRVRLAEAAARRATAERDDALRDMQQREASLIDACLRIVNAKKAKIRELDDAYRGALRELSAATTVAPRQPPAAAIHDAAFHSSAVDVHRPESRGLPAPGDSSLLSAAPPSPTAVGPPPHSSRKDGAHHSAPVTPLGSDAAMAPEDTRDEGARAEGDRYDATRFDSFGHSPRSAGSTATGSRGTDVTVPHGVVVPLVVDSAEAAAFNDAFEGGDKRRRRAVTGPVVGGAPGSVRPAGGGDGRGVALKRGRRGEVDVATNMAANLVKGRHHPQHRDVGGDDAPPHDDSWLERRSSTDDLLHRV